MMGFVGQTIGKIFGTDQAAAALIDNVSNGLDKLVYTGEEKAADQAAAVTEARQMVIKWLAATSGQNLARRVLALTITAVWLSQYLFMGIMSVVAIWASDPAPFIASYKIMGDYAETMRGAVMLILAFYFAAPHMANVVDVALKKFGEKK